MKLPEDPKERMQIFVLAAIMGITVVTVLVMFVVNPRLVRKAEIIEERALVEDELGKAEKDVSRMKRGITSNKTILENLVSLTREGGNILQPRFGGNYKLVAQEIVERAAEDAGATVDIREAGFSVLPKPKQQKDSSLLKYYRLNVSLRGGLHDLVRLATRIEASSPYCSVDNLSIKAQDNTPGGHAINMIVSWPVWANQDTLFSFEQQLSELNR